MREKGKRLGSQPRRKVLDSFRRERTNDFENPPYGQRYIHSPIVSDIVWNCDDNRNSDVTGVPFASSRPLVPPTSLPESCLTSHNLSGLCCTCLDLELDPHHHSGKPQ